MSQAVADRQRVSRWGFTRPFTVALGLLTISPAALAQQYPIHHPVAGGIAVIALNIDGDEEIQAKFGRTPILTLTHQGKWIGVVGIDLDTAQGNYLLTVTRQDNDPVSLEFSVRPHRYPLKSKRLRAVRKANFNPPSGWRPDLDATFPLLTPIPAKAIILFGTRYSTGKDAEPERGVAFPVRSKHDVLAPGEGIILDVVKDGDEGPVYVTIDHGMGLFSWLGPVARVLKKNGQVVAKGEVVGEFDPERTGSRGLYWKTALNGALVDPLLLTDRDSKTDGQ